MTNEEKAIELDKKFREAMFSPKEYHFTDCLLEMAEWKNEQHAQEKQQLIEKACEWLTNNISKETFIISDGNVSVNFKGVIEAFKKVMEEL